MKIKVLGIFTLAWLGLGAATAEVVTRVGDEFQVNTYEPNNQVLPEIASAAEGDFVVVWNSWEQDGLSWGVFGQRFGPDGEPVGDEIEINTFTMNAQRFPVVASDAAGNFVAVWDSDGQDGSGFGVFGQRFAANGTLLGDEFQVNSYTTYSQMGPAVSSDADGNFVVVWSSYLQNSYYTEVLGQRFAANGDSLGGEFQVNSFPTYSAYSAGPDIASDADGDFVVVWSTYYVDGSIWGLASQRFAADASRLGDEFQVNSYTTSSQIDAEISFEPGGDFMVVWESYGQDGSNFGIFGQRFAANGSRLGDEFQINSYTSWDQWSAAVEADSEGTFTVVWASYSQDGSDYAVMGRRIAADGTILGGEFQVNTFTTNKQWFPAIASDDAGTFTVVWGGYEQDGSGSGIFGQQMTTPIFTDGFESGNTSAWSSTQ